MEQDIAFNTHSFFKIMIDSLDFSRDEFVYLRLLGEVCVGGIRHVVALSPLADVFHINIDHGGYVGAILAKSHGLFDVWTKLEFILDELWSEFGPINECRHVFDAIDHHEMPLRIKKGGIARVEPSISDRIRCRCRIFEIP